MDDNGVQDFEIYDLIEEEERHSSPLIEEVRAIWEKLGLRYPDSDMTLEDILADNNVEYASEIINRYDKASFREFVRLRLFNIAVSEDIEGDFIELDNEELDNEELDNEMVEAEAAELDYEDEAEYEDEVEYEPDYNYDLISQQSNEEIEDEEIDRWYETIESFVGQLKELLRNNDVSNDHDFLASTSNEPVFYSIAEINYTNFKTLFNEPYDRYCSPTSIESRTSPIAYLTFIFKLALDIESFSAPESLKLRNRRPDLFELVLNEENTYTEIKTIVLVNEILKSGIQNYLKNSADKDIYSVLAKTHYPSLLPINFHYEKIKYAFLDKRSSIRELKEAFEFNDYITKGKLYSGVPLSTEQMSVLLDYNTANLPKYFNVKNITELKDFRFFLEKTQMTSQELESILETKLLFGASNKSVTINSEDPKNLIITNLDNANLFKIHKTICLNRWFGISLKDSFILIHHILKGLGTDQVTKQAIHSVEYFNHLKNKYNVSLKDYVSLIDVIPDYSFGSGERSFYDEIFNKDRKTLALTGATYSLSSHSTKDGAIILDLSRALDLITGLFEALAKEVEKSKGSALKMNLEDVSTFYRIIRLAKILGLDIEEFLSICEILKYDLYTDLKDHQKIYSIEIFSSWIKSTGIPLELIETIVSPVSLFNIKFNIKQFQEILDFVLEMNEEIESWDNEITMAIANGEDQEEIKELINSKEEKISKQLLNSLGDLYNTNIVIMKHILKILKIDIDEMISEIIDLKDIENVFEIDLSHLQTHSKINWYCFFVGRLDLSERCLRIFIEKPKTFGVKDTTLNLESFYALWLCSKISKFQVTRGYDAERDELYFEDGKYDVEDALLTLLDSGRNDRSPRLDLLANIIEITEKEVKDIIEVSRDITTVQEIYTLHKLKLLSKKLNLPIKSLFQLNNLKDDSSFETVKKISEEAITGYFDSFEKKQRDIFVDFYLTHVVSNSFSNLKDYIKTPNDLYECLLIDNQVSTEVITSRVSSAIATVQQFINGATIGIEPGQNVPKKIADEWLQNNSEYAIWAANIMLYLYPANYIDPSLRQNKSEFFSKLENALSQAGLNEEKVQAGVLAFLNDFEKVADLRVVSCYCHGAKKNARKNLAWAQGLVREKNLYYYEPVKDAVWRHPRGYDNSLGEGMFYSIAVSSQDWVLGKLYNDNSSDFVWIPKSKLDYTKPNANKEYSIEDDLEINKFLETFDLLDATLYLVSQTKYAPVEYYLRSVDMSQSLNGMPNPLAWSDYYKIDLPLSNLVPGSIRPVVFSNRVYIMYGEVSYTSKEETTSSGAVQATKIEHLNLMLGYRTFDGTWSSPQNMGSITPQNKTDTQNNSSIDSALETTINTFLKGTDSVMNEFSKGSMFDAAKTLETTLKNAGYAKTDTSSAAFSIIDAVAVLTTIIPKVSSIKDHLSKKSLLEAMDTLDTVFRGIGYTRTDIKPTTAKVDTTKPIKTDILLHKAIAFSIGNEKGDEKCILGLICNNGSIIKSIDKVMSISDVVIVPDATFTHTSNVTQTPFIPALNKILDSYRGNRVQNSLSSINSDASEIMNVTIEWHADGNIGTAQYLKYDKSQFLNYRPIRLNSGFARTLIARASLSIFNLLTWDTQTTREPQIPGGEQDPMVDFNGANGKYFWELFFHLPFMITNRFKNEHNYKDAIRWMKLIFDPTAKNKTDGSPNYWNVRVLSDEGHVSQAVHRPADPDALAASNPIEYKKALFYLMLDIIIDEADENYRMLTPDSLNRAKQLYIQLLALLGDRPDIQLIKTWMSVTLEGAVNSQNNALTAIEAAILAGNVDRIDNPGLKAAASSYLETMNWMSAGKGATSMFSSIFRVPLNKKLLGYWDIIESRLFNLRHNLSITGSLISIGLFATPMDPKDLLRARGSGGNSPLAVARLNVKVPPYKFRSMIDQAKNAVSTFCMFGDRLLGYMEVRDGKAEQEMDISFSIEMSNYSISLQEQSAKMLLEEKKSLEITKSIYEQEYSHYKKLYDQNLNPAEITAITLRSTAAVFDGLAIGHRQFASYGDMVPTIFGVAFGGARVSAALKGLSLAMTVVTNKMNHLASGLDQGANYQRRREGWELAYKSAEKQLAQVNNSIAIHELQVKASQHTISQLRREQDHIKEKHNFLKKKFTNKELYEWLVGQMSTLYLQMYEIALDMSLAAEAGYRFESGDYHMKFIQPSGFNNLYRGLNCGEILRVNLEQMSTARWRKYEKHLDNEKDIFLSELFGDEWDDRLAEFKETGEIFFEFPEILFAKDQPGQYYRQISSMSFTMENPERLERFDDKFPNWVVPVYTQAKLTQTFNALIHVDDKDTFDYVIDGRNGGKPDATSYLENMRSGQSVNISQKYLDLLGQLSGDGERYLPFEGTGLLSEWHLVFTNEERRKEDLEDLFDIRFRVRYTSLMGSPAYAEHVKNKIKDM